MVSRIEAAARELQGWTLDYITRKTAQPCPSCGHSGDYVTTEEIAQEFFEGDYNSARGLLRKLKRGRYIHSVTLPPRPKAGTTWARSETDDDGH